MNLIAILLQFRSTIAFQLAIARKRRRRDAKYKKVTNFNERFYTSCIAIEAAKVTASNCEVKLFLYPRRRLDIARKTHANYGRGCTQVRKLPVLYLYTSREFGYAEIEYRYRRFMRDRIRRVMFSKAKDDKSRDRGNLHNVRVDVVLYRMRNPSLSPRDRRTLLRETCGETKSWTSFHSRYSPVVAVARSLVLAFISIVDLPLKQYTAGSTVRK